MSDITFEYFVAGWIIAGLLIFPVVLKITAPYGRHTSSTWGALMDNRLGWIMMELPALLVFCGFFRLGSGEKPPVTYLFASLWMIHYINRTLIFPFRLRTKGKKMPVLIALMAIFFNLINGSINGYFLGSLADSANYPATFMTSPPFIIGIILFITGLVINWHADHVLIHLRKPGENRYVIPDKGLFRLVSCPNHFGEIVEWTGFAIMTWSLPGLAFAVWTIVNLLPRALQHHRWYKQTFDNYPAERKALFPYLL